MKSKKRKLKRSVSVILAVMMVFTAVPAFAWADTGGSSHAKAGEPAPMTAQAVTPAKANEAVAKFTDAMSKFYADTSQLSGMSSFLTRFGGVTSAASGVIGILQMSGVIQDPTQQALGEILETVKDIQTKLNQMDEKLDDINKQLVSIAVRQEEKDRNNKATTMMKYWRDFNRDYCEPLDGMVDEYQGMINAGVRSWWEQSSREGVRLLYTKTDNGTYSLTYSREDYGKGYPDKADNGEAIATSECVSVPAEWMPDTGKMAFKIDSYQEDFEAEMAKHIEQAADRKELEADDGFYQMWDKETPEGKQEIAETYAHDAMNTLLYHIACDVMSSNDKWVISVTNAYRKYCNNVLAQDSGVNAMLNAMYLTHGFEGEIKQDIKDFCDQMAAKAGVYGQFALTCAGQDSLQSLAKRQDVQTLFADTVVSLYDRKDKALTGFDNYCYITGTRIEHDVIEAKAETTIQYTSKNTKAYKGYTSKDWTITVPSILDNVYSRVLYDQYKSLPQGKSSFSSYLKAYGAFPTDNWNGNIMTHYVGAQTFSLNEGIRMKANDVYGDEDYFKEGSYYNIDVGTGSKVEQKYYHIHDKVLCDYFNMETGTLAVNQMAAARAMYGESHWNWITDECWFFSTDGAHYRNAWDYESNPRWLTEKYRARFDVLKLLPAGHEMNGDEDEEDPFFAFDAPSLDGEVAGWMGPIYQDTAKALTDVILESGPFIYTGEAIEPTVAVKAGKKFVPSTGYTVTYDNNTDIGLASITIRGTGDYSGAISYSFSIVPDGTAITKLKKKKNAAAVTWKKQAEKFGDRQINGYQIRYSTKASMKKAKTLTVKGLNKTSAKVKGLKKNQKYYFQIRTYVKFGKGAVYSPWSGKKSVRIKK